MYNASDGEQTLDNLDNTSANPNVPVVESATDPDGERCHLCIRIASDSETRDGTKKPRGDVVAVARQIELLTKALRVALP